MAAPFNLPDTMDVWNHEMTFQKATGVACRQVPRWGWLPSGSNFTSNSYKPGWTHWVDFEVGTEAIANFDTVGTLLGVHWPDDGDIIEVYAEVYIIRLLVAWVEVRYSNTPNVYLRAYGMQQGPVNPL